MSTGTVRSAPLTVVTPMRKRNAALCRLFLLYMRRYSKLVEVSDLKFIHFARWQRVRVDSLPRFDGQPPEDLDHDLFVFSTNFNGPWDQYIDTFARVQNIRKGIRWFWRFSEGFPGPLPIRNFKQYIRYHSYPEQLYYDAYPDASVRDIAMALTVSSRLDEFIAQGRRESESGSDFAARFVAFVNDLADLRSGPASPPSTTHSFLTAISPIETGSEQRTSDALRRYLKGAESAGNAASPLACCPMVHMARLVILDDLRPALGDTDAGSLHTKYLLFIAELDGPIDDFLDHLYRENPDFVAKVWGGCLGYPEDEGPVFFRQYIETCSFAPDLPFAAFPGRSVSDIERALARRQQLMGQIGDWKTAPTTEQWRDFEAGLGGVSLHG